MTPKPPPIRRVQHVGIKVRDLDEAEAFYRNVMGVLVQRILTSKILVDSLSKIEGLSFFGKMDRLEWNILEL
jgi:catechol 2,3-dioxygenase-like lactoylglutathione lyase family enzyme